MNSTAKILFVCCITALLCIACNYTHAQTGSLQLALSPLPEFKDSVQNVKLSIYITKGNNDGAKDYMVKDTDVNKWSPAILIDDLIPGTYDITIDGVYPIRHGISAYRYCLNGVKIKDVVISAGKATPATTTFPGGSCKYYKDFCDKRCPKCHKADKVVPNVFGELIMDPMKGPVDKQNEFNLIDRGDPTCCEPVWYCNRDHIMF